MKYHDIDNELIKNFLIHVDQSEDQIKKDIIDWHLALNKGDEEDCAKKAKKLLRSFISSSIDLLGINTKTSNQDLFEIYGSLDNILRIAIFLRKDERIRDHLNHTIRNILFSIFLMNNVWRINEIKLMKKLIIACAFHDIAYPIEKLKKVATQIIDSTLSHLINSNGIIDINITEPDKLLELLDFVGNDFGSDKFSSQQKDKINILYRYTLIPAIAGRGIFEIKHCLSSVIIFLRYLYDYSDIGKSLMRDNIDDILDICFAISYHDRDRDIDQLSEVLNIVKILRVTDELQEWDRDNLEYSFYSDVQIENSENIIITFKMKSIDKESCNPFKSICDKIKGLSNCIDDITLRFEFPEQIQTIKTLADSLVDYFKHSDLKFNYIPSDEKYSIIDIKFINNNISLSYKS